MEGVNPPKYTKAEVSQKFNLKKILGYDPTEEQKQLFYELVVDRIVTRTTDGKDIEGKKFTKYSEQYAEKKGVSRDSVDLVLNGDMLNSFEESVERKNIIKVAVGEGVETLKSFNHNVGDTLPKRTYFGVIKDSELNSIKREVDSLKTTRQEQPQGQALTLADIRAALNELDITFEGFNGEG